MPITSIVPISPIVNIDVTSESKVILLPAASTCIGTTFTLRDSKGAASTNSIFVSTIGLDRVDGNFFYPLTSTLETLKVMSLGNTSWSLVQRTTTTPSFIASGTIPLATTIILVILLPLFVSPNTWNLYITWTPRSQVRIYGIDNYTIIDTSGNSITNINKDLTTYTLPTYIVGLNTYTILSNNLYGSTPSEPYSLTISGTPSLTWLERTGLTNAISIVSSSDGAKFAAAVNAGSIFTSTNSGATWTERTTAGTRNWSSITTSSNGTNLAAVVNGGGIYTSSDSGATWTGRAVGSLWRAVLVYPNGSTENVVGIIDGGYIYTSSDSGATWTQLSGAGSRNWISITATASLGKLAGAVAGGYLYYTNDGGASWTEQTDLGTQNWSSMAADSTGTKLVAVVNGGGIYTSDNGGVGWTQQVYASRAYVSVTSSSDGVKLAVAINGGYINTSDDSGVTWTAQDSGSRDWISITTSSDGVKLAAAVYGGYIYTSDDSGETWTERDGSGSRNWKSITSSSDGVKLAAAVALGSIYTSGDSGETWTEQTDAGSRNWISIASSSNGRFINAAVYGGSIYRSTNSGANWSNTTDAVSYSWKTIASSSDGVKLAAASTGGYIFTSTNSGASWTQQTASGIRSWISIASSSNGTKLFAVASTSIIYISTNSGVAWTGVDLSTGGLPPYTPSFTSISCSSDGTSVASTADYVFTSTNSGATWTKRTSSGSRSWNAITMSSDGGNIAATVDGGSIYTSTDGGSTWTEELDAGSRNWTSITSASDGGILAASVSSASAWARIEGPPVPPVAFFPNSISGLIIQTDAYSLTDADGTVLTGWNNLGSGGSVSCTGTVNTNVLNGQRVVTFSSSATWTPANNVSLSAYSMFFVTRQTGSTNDRIFQDSGTTSAFGYLSIGGLGKKKVLQINLSDIYLASSSAPSDTSWDMISHTRTQNSSYIFKWDGSVLYSGSSLAGGILTKPVIASTDSSNSQVAEFILYDSVLTPTQITKIEGYLAWKWGLVGNLPSLHPYKTSYPTV
jgi:hypothetical protein